MRAIALYALAVGIADRFLLPTLLFSLVIIGHCDSSEAKELVAG